MASSQAAQAGSLKDLKSMTPQDLLKAISERLTCPLSADIMTDPVIIDKDCRHLFNREDIESFYAHHKKSDSLPNCPAGCNTPVRSLKLTPIRELKAISELLPQLEKLINAKDSNIQEKPAEKAALGALADDKWRPPATNPNADFKLSPASEAFPPPSAPGGPAIPSAPLKNDSKTSAERIKKLIGLRLLQNYLRRRFVNKTLGMSITQPKSTATTGFTKQYRDLRSEIARAYEHHLSTVQHKHLEIAAQIQQRQQPHHKKRFDLYAENQIQLSARIAAIQRGIETDITHFENKTIVELGQKVKNFHADLSITTYQFATLIADHKRLSDQASSLKTTIIDEKNKPLKAIAFFEKLAQNPSNLFKEALNHKLSLDAKREERTIQFINTLSTQDKDAFTRARTLLNEGIDIDILTRAKDAKSLPAFMTFIKTGRKDVIDFLLSETKININRPIQSCVTIEEVKWPSGTTPLMLASYYKESTHLIELLIDANANIKATTIIGRTALHFACLAGNYEATSILLNRGADKLALDEKFTPAIKLIPAEHQSRFHGLFTGSSAPIFRLT